jgi:threonine dehydrogenase-like Zn-dependent dehydrogenase
VPRTLTERGDEGIERIRELTGGDGTHTVLECVGTQNAIDTPARAYIEELMPDILSGTIQPGKMFDHTVALDDVPAGYRAMADRTSLKVLIRP